MQIFHVVLKWYSILFFKRKEPKESAFLQCLNLYKHLRQTLKSMSIQPLPFAIPKLRDDTLPRAVILKTSG
jgi:hypothetical protein